MLVEATFRGCPIKPISKNLNVIARSVATKQSQLIVVQYILINKRDCFTPAGFAMTFLGLSDSLFR